MKSRSKSELAMAAGVSLKTFSRWLSNHHDVLLQMGIQPSQRLLPPKAVLWICEEYGIDRDELAA